MWNKCGQFFFIVSVFVLKPPLIPALIKHIVIITFWRISKHQFSVHCIGIHMDAPETPCTFWVISHVVEGKCLWFHTPLLQVKQTEGTEACFYRWNAQRGWTRATCWASALGKRKTHWRYICMNIQGCFLLLKNDSVVTVNIWLCLYIRTHPDICVGWNQSQSF